MTTQLNETTREYIGSCLSDRYQELIILPTEKCNFRCTYCYEDFELGKMSSENQMAIKKFMSKRAANLDHMNLSWFGGEPLLAKDVVLNLSRHAHQLSEEYGFKLTGGLTTNAYTLTVELFEELIALNQTHFQISLDGWKDVHDSTRKRADGGKTFNVIWENLNNLKKVDGEFEIVLRIHISESNKESLFELCKHLHKNFSDDPRFSLNVQDIRDLGGKGGKTVTSVTNEEYLSVENQLYKVFHGGDVENSKYIEIPNYFKSESFGSSKQHFDTSESSIKYICYAAKPNSIMIRSDGRIGKCTVMLSDERNSIGKINADGSLDINNNKLKPWMNGFTDFSQKALACPAPYLDKSEKFKDSKRIQVVTE
jgi:uncharacterized protein